MSIINKELWDRQVKINDDPYGGAVIKVTAKLKELYGEVPDTDGWYCPHCRRAVPPDEATYEETHTECGTPLGVAPPNSPVPADLEAMVREMAMVASRIYSGLPKLTDKETEHCVREFTAQLKELFPIPADLEAAVRGVVNKLFPGGFVKNHKENLSPYFVIRDIVSAVGPLLAEKERKLAESHEVLLGACRDRDKRIAELKGAFEQMYGLVKKVLAIGRGEYPDED